MPSTESNFTVTPTPGGGFVGVTSDGFSIHQLAMRAMQQSDAAAAVVQLSDQGLKDQDNPTVVTGVIDRDGKFRILHRTNEADPASLVLRSLSSSAIITTTVYWFSRHPCPPFQSSHPLPLPFSQT
ncbi:hypothetical protein H9Q74_000059 [Fusarium xylarioides]|nr:hypothetical protein H9Q71_000143 [Fusarium xylarioides]KAG5829906.1 hypothetical protein H9Q74_000059 [Fusarium xylarioides]